MEYDFSDQAKEFLESQAAKRPGRKSGAQTPAKPSERKKGSKIQKTLVVTKSAFNYFF